MDYIAHIRESDNEIQSVESHLLEVKDLAESFGEKIGVKHLTGLAGVLHDLGKFTNEFKEYILAAVNDPDNAPKRGSVDHSTAGGKLLFNLFHDKTTPYKAVVAEIVGNAILSHHSYLQDFLNQDLESPYLKRVRDKELTDFNMAVQEFFDKVMNECDFKYYVDQAAAELKAYLAKDDSDNNDKNIMFLTKFIFSSLIDGDRTNTRLFEENHPPTPHVKSPELFQHYYNRLIEKIESFKNHKNADTPINKLRSEMSGQCERFAEKPSGIYTLSIPTGGGKTLASLRYALKHSLLHNKKRIIYVVPYTTIIEQNAEEVRNILKDNANILEHHSNVIDDNDDNDESQDGLITDSQKLKLAKDNWDSPIIFTTMVQFLNVFYAKGSRNVRRLHNLSDSVIIFDEVQKVPTSSVSLFNNALNFLKKHCQVSILLCTATQPALDFVEHKLEINPDAEIISDLNKVIKSFERVEILNRATSETFDNEKLSKFILNKMDKLQNILVILNTKTVVKKLYNQLLEAELSIPVYHLSTSMCAAHRNKILKEIRWHLEQGNKIICISTQLIEAGVDISFECVIRSLASLDSIAQAAGRCNRHGERELQNVYVIDHEEENLTHLKEIKLGKKVTSKILVDMEKNPELHEGNLLSTSAMEKFFREYYTELGSDLYYFVPKLQTNLTELLFDNENSNSNRIKFGLFNVNSYNTAAEHYQAISDMTTSVIVPFDKGRDIIAQLNGENSIEDLSKLLRMAQQYTINIFRFEKDQLIKNDGLVSYLEGKVLALKEGAYSQQHGLVLDNDSELSFALF